MPNRPPGTDILQLVGGVNQTYRVTLSEPILDPIMAVLSLGSSGRPTTYNFDSPFTIVSRGTGFWGGNVNTLQQLPGNVLLGNEGHGTLKFLGTFDTFSWTVPTPETWHGFTFAVRTSASLAQDGFYVVDLAPGEAETAKDFGNKTDPNPPANRPPEFVADPPTAATANEPYTYRPEAIDLDGDTLTFALGEHPDGMVIDPATGVVAWVPALNQAGTADRDGPRQRWPRRQRHADVHRHGRGGAAQPRPDHRHRGRHGRPARDGLRLPRRGPRPRAATRSPTS